MSQLVKIQEFGTPNMLRGFFWFCFLGGFFFFTQPLRHTDRLRTFIKPWLQCACRVAQPCGWNISLQSLFSSFFNLKGFKSLPPASQESPWHIGKGLPCWAGGCEEEGFSTLTVIVLFPLKINERRRVRVAESESGCLQIRALTCKEWSWDFTLCSLGYFCSLCEIII